MHLYSYFHIFNGFFFFFFEAKKRNHVLSQNLSSEFFINQHLLSFLLGVYFFYTINTKTYLLFSHSDTIPEVLCCSLPLFLV